MYKKTAQIYYLYHSGFAVKTLNHFLVFDYFNDTPDSGERGLYNGVVSDFDIKTNKNIFVFSSHSHEDHFNPVILEWQKNNPDIHYILSSDIELQDIKQNYHIMALYKGKDIDNVKVKTYGSTDIGVSFLVNVDGLNIFHAGDLNWWHWKEDTDLERSQAEAWFKDEIEKITGEKIDIAFFPVDPRLEEYYSIGAEYFIEKIQPNMLVPMHFGDNPEITKKFADKANTSSTIAAQISQRGQQIIY